MKNLDKKGECMKQNTKQITILFAIIAMHESIDGSLATTTRQLGRTGIKAVSGTLPGSFAGLNSGVNRIQAPTFTPAPITIPNYTSYTMPSYTVPQRFNSPRTYPAHE